MTSAPVDLFAALEAFGATLHALVVERFNGTETYQDDFDAPETVTGFYSDRTVYSNGQVVAQGRFAFPIGVAQVPPQSRVTLPAEFGTNPDGSPRTYRVVDAQIGNGGGLPTPDHQTIGLM